MKTIWVTKNFGSKKIWGEKFWGPKNLGTKILGTKILGSKNFGVQNFGVQNFGVQKCLGHFCGWAVKTGIVHWITYLHYYSFQAYNMWTFQPNSIYDINI